MAKKQKSVDAKVSTGPKLSKAERCKWDPSYCAKVEKLGAAGKSAPEIRRELAIPVSTWRAWVKKHAEFAEAVEEAADQAEAWWIDLGRKGMMLGTNFQRADVHLPHEEHLPSPVPRPSGPSDHRR